MATLSSPNLQIIVDRTKQTARVIVSGSVTFTEYERNQMTQGLKFRLECRVIGDDASPGAGEGWWIFADRTDDVRHVFAPKMFPDASPSTVEKYSFEATVGLSVLDEDVGTDEIYSKVTIINTYTQIRNDRRSNRVDGDFKPIGPR